jgi:hypothetical protein
MIITTAKYLGSYRILATFNNGQTRQINLYRFIKQSQNPLIRKYLDKTLFAGFTVQNGTICWGNDFDLSPMSIYQGFFDSNN